MSAKLIEFPRRPLPSPHGATYGEIHRFLVDKIGQIPLWAQPELAELALRLRQGGALEPPDVALLARVRAQMVRRVG